MSTVILALVVMLASCLLRASRSPHPNGTSDDALFDRDATAMRTSDKPIKRAVNA